MHLKRLTALLLALMMIISLAACNAPVENPDNAVSKSSASTSATASDTSVATDEKPPADEPSPNVNLGVSTDRGNFESNNDSVSMIEVSQVMSYGQDMESGELFPMYEFVAGKETAIVVKFAEARDVQADGSMTISIERDGEEIASLMPINSGESDFAIFKPRSLSDIDSWQAGSYKFTYLADDGEISATRTAKFLAARAIKVLAVPVLANYGGEVVGCEGEWKTAITFTRKTYPLAADNIEYVLGNELDLSSGEYDLTNDEGMFNVWQALANLQTPSNDYELILGFVRNRQGAEATTQGYTYGKPANIITESDGDMQPTVAHEIAHCYLVGDEYPGGSINNAINPAPYGMEGSDWVNRDQTTAGNKEFVVSSNDYGNENSGSIIYPEQRPLDATDNVLLDNVGSFMGSGSSNIEDYWITSAIWSQLYKAFVTGEVGNAETETDASASGLSCPICFESAAQEKYAAYCCCGSCGEFTEIALNAESSICSSCGEETPCTQESVALACPSCGEASYISGFSSQKAVTGKVAEAEPKQMNILEISGSMTSDGVFVHNPWYVFEGSASDINAKIKGNYSVEMYSADGSVMSKQYFDINFNSQSNPPTKLAKAPVNVWVKYPDGAVQIAILKGKEKIFTKDISANAPTAEFTGIAAGDTFSGKQTISWAGSDADGDALTYDLWYCASEDDYISLASNVTGNSATVDFTTLPGTDSGYLYMFATDGVNTTTAFSEDIAVDYKAPEILSAQSKVPEYRITDEIVLDADIYDIQDGWLYDDASVIWSLNGREFMSGSMLWVYPYELTPGEQTFTLTATNSHGKSVKKDFKFNIANDESALPSDWSKEDVKAALSNGFIAPLSSVKSPITRGQYASLMSTLYFTVLDDASVAPEYEEGVVKDCGNDDYNQFLMVSLGVMSADGGKFNPNGRLTQHEAAVIMYKICSIADPAVAEPIADENEMLDILAASAVIDESGENAFAPDLDITGQLALVRCNRIYTAIWGN